MNDDSPTDGIASSHQVGGNHYARHRIQPWDIIEEYDLDFFAGNALKYLLRQKEGVARLEDLQNLRHYVDKLIKRQIEIDREIAQDEARP